MQPRHTVWACLLYTSAHERTDIDINKQMKKHDDEIMDDDDF